MIRYPEINPYIFKLGSLEVRWYGLAYILGILLGFKLIAKYLKSNLGFTKDEVYDFITYIIIGVMIGGRVGYIIFYDIFYYLNNLPEIIAFWHGGMSYHGGALGVVFSTAIYCKRHKKNFLGVMDLIGVGSTIGIGLGRITNFINAELVGRVTNVPWAMIFPQDRVARHPSQLYEAFFEGLVLFVVLYLIMRFIKLKHGGLFALYLIFYGLFRFFLEFFREPDIQLGYIVSFLTAGQILCLVMVVHGVLIYYYSQKKTV